MPTEITIFQAAVPILTVENVQDAVEYYQHVLGFQTGWVYGDPPQRASVFREKVELNLRERQPGEPALGSKVYFELTDVDSFFDLVKSRGALVTVPPADRFYGMRDFSMRDPSGNDLTFGRSTVG